MENEVTLLGPPHPREAQYEILRSIGSGSFGQVYLVLHQREQRQYVMKKIAQLATMDEKQRESTEMEVKLLSGMRHPTIVAFRDSFVSGQGELCILMEYCDKGDLSTYLQQNKKAGKAQDEGRLLEWFIHVILALHALHLKKILHRDLKTQNIFLTGHRSQQTLCAKLGDFGISTVLNSTTDLAMTQIGTPFYMSPELINNKPYSYKSDIWGLGCVLYEIINGHRAFDAQGLNALALKIIKGHYTPITSNCSNETKALIKSTLSKNPQHRPTLKEILHMPHVRRRIQPASKAVTEAHYPEMRGVIEDALSGQLASLGLSGLLSGGRARESHKPKRDKQQILMRLEQAELRKKREEEALTKLQQTAALLAQCLDGADEFPPPPQYLVDRPLDRDRRRPSRKHATESNFGHFASEPMSSSHAPPRMRARTDDPTMTAGQTSLDWLLEYEHITAQNLERPFEACRPNVMHSPQRNRTIDDYCPPPPSFGEPVPPPNAPPTSTGMWSSWRQTEPRSHSTRPPHGVCLRSLTSIEPRSRPEMMHSDDSHSIASSDDDFLDDGMSDMDIGEEQLRERSHVVQQAISRCQSAIGRHKMTIGMLQYSFAQDRASLAPPSDVQPLDLTGDSSDSSIGMVNEQESMMGRRGMAPAIVQDCVARLTRRCLESLGSDKFQSAKMTLQTDSPAEVARGKMLEVLGFDHIGFYSLIDQIVHMERKWGFQDIS